MLGNLAELAATLAGIVIAFLVGKRLVTDAASAKAREEIAAEAAEDANKTRERIDDATRNPLPADTARERLRRFGAGGAPGETGTPPER